MFENVVLGLGIALAAILTPPYQVAHSTPLVDSELASTASSTQIVDIDTLITQAALKWHVSRTKLYDTLNCESAGFRDVAIPGDNGLARGLAQIRSDYHPEVSDEQADDPEFAVNFMAQYFSENKASQWTCYRNLEKKYGDSWPLNP